MAGERPEVVTTSQLCSGKCVGRVQRRCAVRFKQEEHVLPCAGCCDLQSLTTMRMIDGRLWFVLMLKVINPTRRDERLWQCIGTIPVSPSALERWQVVNFLV